MELGVFEQTAELVRALLPSQLGDVRVRSHRRGVKVWFGPDKPTKLHYEAQVIPDHLGPAGSTDGVALEVGFHAEHRDEQINVAVIEKLSAAEKKWRPRLGTGAEAGPFLGNEQWGRLSETWREPSLEDPDIAFELASRLVDYIETVQPLLPTD